MKTKINNCCSFHGNQLKFLDVELRSHLQRCIDEKLPLRLYQMENMVRRSEDTTIDMKEVPPRRKVKFSCYVYCLHEAFFLINLILKNYKNVETKQHHT